MARKYTRFHSLWMHQDIDYKHKLNPSERQFLEKFIDEYYRMTFKKDGSNLFSAAVQKMLIREQNVRWKEVTTQTSDNVAKHLARPLKRMQDGHRYYSPDDYKFTESAESPEDALIEMMDSEK